MVTPPFTFHSHSPIAPKLFVKQLAEVFLLLLSVTLTLSMENQSFVPNRNHG